jgi:hypothetical protein
LDDGRVTSLSVSTALSIHNGMDGRWVVREVSNRVDFVLDGRGLSGLVEATEIGGLDYQVTPFELITIDARSVMAGEAPFEEWIPDTSQNLLAGAASSNGELDGHQRAEAPFAGPVRTPRCEDRSVESDHVLGRMGLQRRRHRRAHCAARLVDHAPTRR